MGADIHMYVERRLPSGSWVMVRDLNSGINAKGLHAYVQKEVHVLPQGYWNLTERNYTLFAALAGVRGDGPDPKGLPEDVSEYVEYYSDRWDADGHSHSWEMAADFMDLYLGNKERHYNEEAPLNEYTQTTLKDGRKYAVAQFLMEMCSVDSELGGFDPDDYRFVFWFDN